MTVEGKKVLFLYSLPPFFSLPVQQIEQTAFEYLGHSCTVICVYLLYICVVGAGLADTISLNHVTKQS